MIKLFNYLIILNIFMGGFVLFTSPFEFHIGYIFIISFWVICILHYHNIGINMNFLIILLVLTFFSLINVYLGNTSLFLVAKQVLGIFITGSTYFLLIRINKYEIDKLFRIYLQIAVIVAAIGIFQEFSYLIGFERGCDYSYIISKWERSTSDLGLLRINSVFMEPSHLATSMAPVVFVSLLSIFRNNSLYLSKKASILVIICFILTFSAVAYIAILISLMLICSNVKKIRHLSFVTIIMSSLIFLSYSYIPEIRLRVDDTLGVASGSIDTTTANPSTFSLASNSYVAYKSFLNNPLFGHGLGSHPISYNKFISGISGDIYRAGVLLINKNDANSLFLRLASETGLFGVVAVLYFIFKFYLKNTDNSNLQIISNGIFCMFIVSLLRQGHYFYNGLFFFVGLYYFAYKIYHSHQLSSCNYRRIYKPDELSWSGNVISKF